MTPLSIALVLSLATQSEPSVSSKGWAQTGRLIDEPSLHLGVRPAVYFDGAELDVGVTVQIRLKLF